MSLVALASSKVSRNVALSPPPPIIATAEVGTKPKAPQKPAEPKQAITDALARVAEYVPTEIIAAYTVTLAWIVSDTPKVMADGHAVAAALPLHWFLGYLFLTPLTVWLLFGAKAREHNQPIHKLRLWPWWEMIAATTAFTVWSAALPKSTFLRFSWFSSGSAAIVLLIASILLPLVGGIVTKRG